jgi:hypothetical protein
MVAVEYGARTPGDPQERAASRSIWEIRTGAVPPSDVYVKMTDYQRRSYA